MEIKDLEEQLKSEADDIKPKDFSQRWQNISGKIELEDKKQKVPSDVKVCITNSSESINGSVNNKSKLLLAGKIILPFIICIAIILSIVLPLTLKRQGPHYYLYGGELGVKVVQETEFYNELNNAGISILNFDLEIEDYFILMTQENEVKGGVLGFFDEPLMCEGKIHFYDDTVKLDEFDKSDYLKYEVNGYVFEYKTVFTTGSYNLKAYSIINRVQYRLQFEFFEEDNSLAMLEKLVK